MLPIPKNMELLNLKIERIYTGFRNGNPVFLLKLPG